MIGFALTVWTFTRRIARTFPWQVWAAAFALIVLLSFGGYCAHRAAEGERARQAAEQAEAERRASMSRERAAGERLNDATTIRDRLEERNDAAEALPDSLPDDRELRRRCRQLRDVGRDLPACRGLEG